MKRSATTLFAALTAVTLGMTATAPVDAAAQAPPDTTGAAIWAHLQASDYADDWSLWPGTEPMYSGNDPHGMLLTTYVNATALRAIESGASRLPAGAIVVKENYMPDRSLAAITTMYKRPGYNPEHNDWFFTKHLPDGNLDQMQMQGRSMPMEGRLPGCQNCHGQVSDNDYLFTSELGSD